jgi:uncharacterized protein YpmB
MKACSEILSENSFQNILSSRQLSVKPKHQNIQTNKLSFYKGVKLYPWLQGKNTTDTEMSIWPKEEEM